MTTFAVGMLMGGIAGYVAGVVHTWFLGRSEGSTLRSVSAVRPPRDLSEPWLATDDPRRTARS